jgi:hypothetical protein
MLGRKGILGIFRNYQPFLTAKGCGRLNSLRLPGLPRRSSKRIYKFDNSIVRLRPGEFLAFYLFPWLKNLIFIEHNILRFGIKWFMDYSFISNWRSAI